jgi:hypothetical protein
MTAYDQTVEAVRLASLEIGASEWDSESQNPNREIRAGRAQGVVQIFTDRANTGHALVSLEIDGMSEKQAVAVLRALEST